MNRDTAVLMLMAFGFGLLMAWGLFYEPISIDKDAASQGAAWVQAVGSILAILVAVAVAAWQHRKGLKRDRRMENARALVAAALAITDVHEMAFEIQIIGLVGIEPDMDKSLNEVIVATQIPDALRNLMDVAHEFPDEARFIVSYFNAVSEASYSARTLQQLSAKNPVSRHSMEALYKKLDKCGLAGETLVSRLNALIKQHETPFPRK